MISEELKSEFLDAAVNNHTRALELLNKHPSLRGGLYLHDETALHFLAVEGYLEAVKFLGKNGFDPNFRNSVNTTSLEDVLQLGNHSIVRALLECGADPNASSDISDCVLGTALSTGDPEMVKLLLDFNVDLSICKEDDLFLELNLPIEPQKREAILKLLESYGIEYKER